MDNTSKIRIRFGDVEVEYEGPEPFLKEDLPELLKAVSALHAATPAQTQKSGAKSAAVDQVGAPDSVSTIARKLGVNSGPDLIVAAAYGLTLRGITPFTDKQVREEMKKATGFYRDTYRTNFAASLARLVKDGRIDNTGGANYSLPEGEKTSLGSRLASA